MTKVEGSVFAYTDFTMVHIIYTVTMMSLRVIVQKKSCSDIMSISGYLNLKFESYLALSLSPVVVFLPRAQARLKVIPNSQMTLGC